MMEWKVIGFGICQGTGGATSCCVLVGLRDVALGSLSGSSRFSLWHQTEQFHSAIPVYSEVSALESTDLVLNLWSHEPNHSSLPLHYECQVLFLSDEKTDWYDFLKSMKLHGEIITTKSLQFIFGFILGIVNSMSFDKCIMVNIIHHCSVLHSLFTTLKILCILLSVWLFYFFHQAMECLPYLFTMCWPCSFLWPTACERNDY